MGVSALLFRVALREMHNFANMFSTSGVKIACKPLIYREDIVKTDRATGISTGAASWRRT